MSSSNELITLKAEQVEELNQKLSQMRHDINNMLSLITAAVEVIRSKPHLTERMVEAALEQPSKIADCIGQFSEEFQRILGVPDS